MQYHEFPMKHLIAMGGGPISCTMQVLRLLVDHLHWLSTDTCIAWYRRIDTEPVHIAQFCMQLMKDCKL